MSSPRHEISVSGSSQPPDVLSETTDLETLFEAIVGKKSAGVGLPNVAEASADAPSKADEVKRSPQPAPYLPPVSVERRASSFVPSSPEIRSVTEIRTVTEVRPVSERPPTAAVRPEPSITMSMAARIVVPAREETPVVDDEDVTDTTPVGWLRVVRRSPWPVMVIVGVMALVTVSALGLRGGSSASRVEPPTVASPPSALPSGYSPQLPAAPPTPVDENLAPQNTAFGDSSWRPAPRVATTPTPSATVPPVAPTPVAPRPAAASASPAPTPVATRPAPQPATASPPGIEEPTVDPSRDTVRVIEAAAPPDPRLETSASTPPAVSSARSSAAAGSSDVVPGLPKPAPRGIAPVVAARRLTGSMPEYSAALRQRRITGVVDVQVKIDLSGRVVSAIAVSGPPPLRQAAEAAVLKWRYTPAMRNGVPIETESKVSFSFDPSQSRRP